MTQIKTEMEKQRAQIKSLPKILKSFHKGRNRRKGTSKMPKDRSPPLTAPEAKQGDWEVAGIHTSPSDMEGASSMSTSGGAASCLDPALDCPGWFLPLASRFLFKKKENKLLYY